MYFLGVCVIWGFFTFYSNEQNKKSNKQNNSNKQKTAACKKPHKSGHLLSVGILWLGNGQSYTAGYNVNMNYEVSDDKWQMRPGWHRAIE